MYYTCNDLWGCRPNPFSGVGDAFTANRSSRPYTTFELDQIRQHAKRYVSL